MDLTVVVMVIVLIDRVLIALAGGRPLKLNVPNVARAFVLLIEWGPLHRIHRSCRLRGQDEEIATSALAVAPR
jgi:hypothetical protein